MKHLIVTAAILIENAPFWVDIIRTPKQKIALLEDFEKKLDLITKSTVNENVTSISGVPSWYLVLIKQILAFTGKNNLLDVWPNLEVFFHGSTLRMVCHYCALLEGNLRQRWGGIFGGVCGWFGWGWGWQESFRGLTSRGPRTGESIVVVLDW